MRSWYVLLFVIIAFIGCEGKQGLDSIEFEFRLLNDQGQPATTFKEGEKIIFSFLITNSSIINIAWYNWCKVYSDKDLYAVFKLVTDDKGEDHYSFIGLPFEPPVLCMDRPILIESGQSYYLKAQWLFNPTNKVLSPGEYKVEFGLSFEFNDQNFSQNFSQSFNIQ